MSKITWIIIAIVILLLAVGGYLGYTMSRQFTRSNNETPSLPFVSEHVIVTSPIPNALVSSPLQIDGQAKGTWFFEASFPVVIMDGNGKVIGTGYAQAQDEWMTTDFVPFRSVMTFTPPETETGTLILQKDNPSGLPEFDDSVSIPIRFR